MHLQGAARLWWNGVQPMVKTWNVFKMKLLEAFPEANDPVSIHEQLMRRRKKSSETIETYFYDQVALGRKGKFDDKAIIKYVIAGIEDVHRAKGVTISMPRSLPELLEQLKWLDGIGGMRSSASESVKASKTEKQCFRCSKPGHIADQCGEKPKARKCFRCESDRHLAKECGLGRSGEPSRPVKAIVVDDEFEKIVSVDEKQMMALIDSGSRVTTMKNSFSQKFGNRQPVDLILKGFGGRRIRVTEKVVAVLKVDDIEENVEFVVVPNFAQDLPVIIGKDVLKRDTVLLTKKNGKVWLAKGECSVRETGELQPEAIVQNVCSVEAYEPVTLDDLNMDGTSVSKEELLECVTKNRDCFSKNYRELGKAKNVELEIVLEDHKPVYEKPYRMEFSRESELNKIVSELLEAGIIEPTRSPYSSRASIVPKKEVKDRFPMPTIEYCLSKLVGSEVFITVDLFSGYYQIPVAVDSRKLTAFSTMDSHYQFVRMPFGLVNGCAVFQRAMNQVVAELKEDNVVVYMDDVILSGKTEEEVLEKFERFLRVLREHGFTVNLKKSQFFKRVVDFLGFEVSKNGVKPGERKLEAVEKFPEPTSKHEVQQFLGLTGVARWILKLQEYEIIFEHRAGTKMRHADSLSRNPSGEAAEEEPVIFHVMRLEIDEDDFLVTMQRQDPKLLEVMESLQQPIRNNYDRQTRHDYELVRNRLMRKVENELKWVVPERVRWRILKAYHDDMGHMGEEKVLDNMKKKFWFKRMRHYVKEFIKACPKCAYNMAKGGQPEGKLNPIPKIAVPFQTIHLDHIGPFPKSANGNVHVLVVVDGYTKFTFLKAVRSTRSELVVKMLVDLTSVFGTPQRMITDRGTAFTAGVFRRFCDEHHINHVLVAVGSPRANGQVERVNRVLLTSVRSMLNEDRKWDTCLPALQWAINNTPNATTGVSPGELVFTFKPRDIIRNEIVLVIHDESDNRIDNVDEMKKRVEESIRDRQLSQKKYYDARRRVARTYHEGEMVLVEKDAVVVGGSRKLEPKFKGPYIVAEVLGHDRYRIRDIPGAQRKTTSLDTVYAADRMKRWCEMGNLDSFESADGMGE
nr:uncharacterized protein K02A2.6-like [Aedes albopictus]